MTIAIELTLCLFRLRFILFDSRLSVKIPASAKHFPRCRFTFRHKNDGISLLSLSAGYGNGGPVPVRRVQIAGHGGPNSTSGQTFYLSGDAMTAAGAGATGGATGNRLVPLVCYDDAGTATASAGSGGTNAYGRTQLVEAQPFLIYEQCDDSLDYCEDSMVVPSTPKKETGSGFLQLPAAIGRRLSQARLSLSSIGRSSTGGGGGDGRGDGTGGARSREPRASLCFLPVSRAISDPSCVLQPAGSQGELGGAGGARFESYYCRLESLF